MIAEYNGLPAICSWIDTPSHISVLRTMRRRLNAELTEGDSITLHKMSIWLDRYFSGANPETPDVLITGSDFARNVMQTLCNIPYGTTVAYGELARLAGVAAAVRAVASAVANNPLSLFIPCHRVICADGSPGRYAGTLDAKKQFLITLEMQSANTPQSQQKNI